MQSLEIISANGKSIGEDGQKGIRRIQFCRVEANAFSWKLNYKKSWNEKHWRRRIFKFSIWIFKPVFANTVLSAGFIISY